LIVIFSSRSKEILRLHKYCYRKIPFINIILHLFFDLEKIFKFRVPYQHMQFVQSACNQALRYRTRRIEKLILDEYISQWYTEFATQFNNKYLVQYVFLFLGKNACSALHT